MHGNVGSAFEQGRFKFLDEQALAAHLGQRTVENFVAACGHAEQINLAVWIHLLQQGARMFGLPQGKT